MLRESDNTSSELLLKEIGVSLEFQYVLFGPCLVGSDLLLQRFRLG